MAKAKEELQLAGISLDRQSSDPKYQQLYQALRQTILTGRLRPGQKLPATRSLAADLGVSRNTVMLAFDMLMSEGYLEGKTGAGTFVTSSLPEDLLFAPQNRRHTERRGHQRPLLSKRGRLIAGSRVSATSIPELIRPFQPGVPALDEFAFEIWTRLVNRQLRMLPRITFGYGDPAGFQPLREAIAAYLRTARAVNCEASQVIIVNGSQQALNLAARVLLDPGDKAWVEDPGYLGAKKALAASGIKLVPVPVDEGGLMVSHGIKQEKHARLAYVTPSHQYPLGVTMSLPRRLELLDWADKMSAWILEDDYDSEIRYTGRPLASLQGMDAYGRVIYIGTFSKILLPALRLGYLVVPPELVAAFSSAKALSDRNSAVLEQAVLAEFIDAGHFGRHVRRMRILYHQRQQTMRDEIDRKLDGGLHIRAPHAGMHVVGWLPPDADDREVSRRAEQQGLTIPPLSTFCLRHRQPPALVLGYAPFEPKAIRRGVRQLANVL